MAKRCFSPAVIVFLMFFALMVFDRPAQADSPGQPGAAGGSSVTKAPQDPLVGSWQCSNGVYDYAIFFQANGSMLQQEPTFGNTRNTTWTRLSDQEITLGGGQVLSVSMDGDDRMSVVDTRVGSTWDCSRK